MIRFTRFGVDRLNGLNAAACLRRAVANLICLRRHFATAVTVIAALCFFAPASAQIAVPINSVPCTNEPPPIAGQVTIFPGRFSGEPLSVVVRRPGQFRINAVDFSIVGNAVTVKPFIQGLSELAFIPHCALIPIGVLPEGQYRFEYSYAVGGPNEYQTVPGVLVESVQIALRLGSYQPVPALGETLLALLATGMVSCAWFNLRRTRRTTRGGGAQTPLDCNCFALR